jgi:diaminopimelate decarboxylase
MMPAMNTEVASKLKRIDSIFSTSSTAPANVNSVSYLTAQRASEVLQTLEDSYPVTVLYDLDALDASFTAVQTGFTRDSEPEDVQFLHCYAIKSCPLSYILHRAISRGFGLETASIGEVMQAMRCGCPSEKIIFDSPCKTKEEIRFALIHGM